MHHDVLDPGLRADRRRHALQPLHRRPLPARQGDRPRRRGRLEDPHRDRLAADRDRRGQTARDAAEDRARVAAQGEGRRRQGAPRGDRVRARRARDALGRDDAPSGSRRSRRSPASPRPRNSSTPRAWRWSAPNAKPTCSAPPSCATARSPSSNARSPNTNRPSASAATVRRRCSSKRRSTPTTSPRSSPAGPASPSAG